MDRQNSQDGKIFCISMQRTGTTSTGRFFHDFGFRSAGWPVDERDGWSNAWLRGDFEAIFNSTDFQRHNAFSDSPWWMPDFYKVLFHRFPGSKFILMTRDPDAWFRSMVAHSNGFAIGDNRCHCRIYRRELEFFEMLESDQIDDTSDGSGRLMTIMGRADHYKDVYRLHNTEVLDFFAQQAPGALYHTQLEDPLKWRKLGAFLGIEVPETYRCHCNASPRTDLRISA